VPFSLEQALAHRVVMLSGDEDALRSRALREITTAATLEDDFDIEVVDASESGPVQWSASAGTAPFLSSRRTVIVRHLLRCDEVETPGWSELPETALLVLVADDESGDESRQSRYATIRTQWERAINKIGGHLDVFKVDPKQVVDSIRQEAVRLGKKMSPKAAETLAEMCGGSLSRATEELEKLALYTGSTEQISETDVKEVALPSREWNVYKMVDGAIQGNGAEALRHLRILVGSATKAEEAAFSRILPTVHRQLRLMWQARIILDHKGNPDDLSPEIQELLAENPAWSKQAPFVRSKTMRAARSVSFDQLTRCFEIIGDADARLKGILPSYLSMETLEQMLLEMIETLRPQVAA
jgi:DNA polymerase-3 subunit delta